jgi:hypothetical protein
MPFERLVTHLQKYIYLLYYYYYLLHLCLYFFQLQFSVTDPGERVAINNVTCINLASRISSC